jgi:4-amino-4-deoxy-L-arabinose transferase-like glycosyltransferase
MVGSDQVERAPDGVPQGAPQAKATLGVTGAAVLLVALGAVLRLVGLDTSPPGLHPDEAVVAHEAWSLWRTGASLAGEPWPLAIPMHDRVWAEATYVWLAAPFSALPLDVRVWARLPAALAGITLLPLAFLLARRLLGPRAALVALALLCVEPLAWHYARLALRATLVPPLVCAGLLLLLGPRSSGGAAGAAATAKRLGLARGLAAGACLALAALTYTPVRLGVPLLLAGAIATRWRASARGPLLACAAVTGAAILAALPWSLSPQGQARFAELSLWTHADGPVHAAWLFAKGYALHLSPRALFWGSSSQGFWAEGVSPLLWVEAPLLLLGLATAARAARRGRAGPRLLLLWLGVAPLAAALTVPAPNLLRAILGLPVWAFLAGLGWVAGRRLLRARAPSQRWASVRARAPLAVAALAVALTFHAGWSYFVAFPGAERRSWFADRGAAVEAALAEAEAARRDLLLDCSWVEAGLIACLGREAQPVITRPSRDRAQVLLRFGPGPTWRGRLTRHGVELER